MQVMLLAARMLERNTVESMVETAAIKSGFDPEDCGIPDIIERYKQTDFLPEFVVEFCVKVIEGNFILKKPSKNPKPFKGTT